MDNCRIKYTGGMNDYYNMDEPSSHLSMETIEKLKNMELL